MKLYKVRNDVKYGMEIFVTIIDTYSSIQEEEIRIITYAMKM